MGSVLDSNLVAEWLDGGEAVDVQDEAGVSGVRETVRRKGAAVGLVTEAIESLAAAASEIAHNQLRHARGGKVAVQAVSRAGVAGLEVVAADWGTGIADPATALGGEARASGSLGIGLSAAYRLVDEMDFDVRLGEGTCVRARKFVSPLPRSEVAVLGRPCEGEMVSGDHATVLRSGDTITLGVADGLGHGPLAREASHRAAAVVRAALRVDPHRLLGEILDACDAPLAKTRGTVMSLLRVDPQRGELTHAAAGNVNTHLYGPGDVHRFVNANRVLGGRSAAVKIPVETVPFSSRQVLVVFTDGLSSRVDVSSDMGLLREPPLVIAQRLLDRFGSSHDDALVLVLR